MLRPSARTYAMWNRVIVTSLFVVGAAGLAFGPTSFRSKCICTEPKSLKIVGHGVAGVHGAGAVTLVMTSEFSVLARVVGLSPRAARSWSITRKTGARLWRTTSPHEIDAA